MNEQRRARNILCTLPLLYLLIFGIIPLYGITLAFRDFSFAGGLFSPWSGLENFRDLFSTAADIKRVLWTTLLIGAGRAALLILAPVGFTLLLDALPWRGFKLGVLLFLLFPQFLSWVVTAGIFRDLFAVDGLVNAVLLQLGVIGGPFAFLSRPEGFVPLLFGAILWRDLGFYSLIHYAALAEIDPAIYEAAALEGLLPGSWQAAWRLKLPMIRQEVFLVAGLVLVSFTSGAFEAIFNLYNPALYPYTDIVDTYVYRTGIAAGRFSLAAAVDLIKSLANLLPALIFFRLVYRRMSRGRQAW